MYTAISNLLNLPAGNEATVVTITAVVAFVFITALVTLVLAIFERILNGNRK